MVEHLKYLRSTVQISKGWGKRLERMKKIVSENEGTCVEDGGRAVRLSHSHFGEDTRHSWRWQR